MSLLNGKPILAQGSGLFASGDTFTASISPPLNFRETATATAGISVVPQGAGFVIEIGSFPPGNDMVTSVSATIGPVPVVLYVRVNRVAELGARGMYEVAYLIAET